MITPHKLFTGCAKCGQTDRSEFYAGSRLSYCKQCHKDAVRRGRLAKKGLTPEDEARIADAQGNKCAICMTESDKFTRSLHMDHCHATGKARAMLCARCNQTLGRVKDDAALLRAMADYIDKYA